MIYSIIINILRSLCLVLFVATAFSADQNADMPNKEQTLTALFAPGNDKEKEPHEKTKSALVFDKQPLVKDNKVLDKYKKVIYQAKLLAINGKIKPAITLIESTIDGVSDVKIPNVDKNHTIDLYYLLAELLIIDNQPKPAIRQINTLMISYPNNNDLIILLAYAETKIYNYQRALALLNSITPNYKQSLNYNLLRGKIYLRLKNYSAAMSVYQDIIHAYPHSVQAWLGLGISSQGNGMYHQAVIAYKQAVENGLSGQPVIQYVNQQLDKLSKEDRRQVNQ